MLSLGEKIKKMREFRNFTQTTMADELKMGQAGYSKIEQGATDVPYSRLEQIAKVLKTSVEDIITFDEKKVFNNYFDNVNQNTTNGNVYGDKEVLGKLEKQYESRITSLETEITRLHTLLEKSLSK